METRDVLTDAITRIEETVERTLDGLDQAALVYRPDPDANSIAWLVWHLTRVEDDHVSEIADTEQAYVKEGWAERLGLAPDLADNGWGHDSEQVGAVRPERAEDLLGYLASVTRNTKAYLQTVTSHELERIIDRRWDPPVTVGVRLVSVIDDCMQHAGQAAYIRGMYERR
jgi:uncharacterized damage-inducible protein DinB